MKFLVFSTDLLPLAGVPTSGTALRTHGICEGLRSFGHEVVVSVPKSALAGFSKRFDAASLDSETKTKLAELSLRSFDSFNQSSIISSESPDVIICGHWPAMALQAKPSQPLVVDLAGPHLLERHYQGAGEHQAATLGKLAVLATADYFIVSGPSQRLYFLSYMLRVGVENPERRIVNITMPLNPVLPKREREQASDYPRFIFGGVFLPWQDPSFGLLQLRDAIETREHGSLSLIGGNHPSYSLKGENYEKLFTELAKSPRVSTLPMLPLESFISELSKCDVAIDLMKWNLERLLALTIRSTTYLWAGLPIIYNDYSDLSRLIKHYDAGWCVPPDDDASLRNVIDQIFDDPQLVYKKSVNAQKLAAEEFSWDLSVKPLLDLIGAKDALTLRETDIVIDYPESAHLEVSVNKPVRQLFLCRINGLSKIECRMKTQKHNSTDPISFRLFRIPGNTTKLDVFSDLTRELVVEKTAAESDLQDNEWFSLDVEAIRDSAGKTFVLEIDMAKPSTDNSVSPWSLRSSPYPLLGLFHGEQKIQRSALCLRTTCVGG